MLVETLSITSENVTEMDVETEVMLSEFDGEVESTVGAVVSISNKPIVSVCDEFDALSIMMNTQIRLIDILIRGTQVEVAFCTLWLYLEGLDVRVNRFLIVGLNVISIT